MKYLFKIKNALLVLSFLYLILIGCTLNGNFFGVSKSVNESMQEGFLVDEYDIMKGDFNLDSFGPLEISEVFIENKWRSNDDLSKTKTSGYQMILLFKDEIPKKYSFDWVCKIEGGKAFTENDKSLLVLDVFLDQMKDTVIVNVFQGDVFYLDSLNCSKKQIVFTKRN